MAGQGGLEKLSVGVLSAEQQEKLRLFKVTSYISQPRKKQQQQVGLFTSFLFPFHSQIKTRIENEKYLRSHSEVEVLIGDFVRLVSCLSVNFAHGVY